MSETMQPLSSSTEMTSEIKGQILDDINLEVISQLEESVARFHAYDAICTHLYRERMPLQIQSANHALL